MQRSNGHNQPCQESAENSLHVCGVDLSYYSEGFSQLRIQQNITHDWPGVSIPDKQCK